MPFAGYQDFAACVADQKTKGHDDDSANKICGYLYNKLEKSEVALTIAQTLLQKAKWSRAYIDDLPDSAFLVIEGGGEKDSDGKTKPRSLRHFPVRDSSGKLDLPHLRNALARIPQSKLPQNLKDKAKGKAQRLLSSSTEKAATDAIDKARKLTTKPKPYGGAAMSGMCKDDMTSGDLNAGGKIVATQIDTNASMKPPKKTKPLVNGIAQTGEHNLSIAAIAAKKSVQDSYAVKLVKADAQPTSPQDERFIMGIVLEPEVEDAQHDMYDEEAIRKTAHDYMAYHQDVKLQHSGAVQKSVKILESYLAPTDFVMNGQNIKKGTWMMAARVEDDDIWADIKNGEITGWSIGGSAIRTTEDPIAVDDSLPE